MVRLFVGAPVGETDGLARAAWEVAHRVAGARVIEPAQRHVTLAFLGDVDASRAEEAGRCLDEAGHDAAAFTLRWRGLGVFPDPARARVVWAGLPAAEEDAGTAALTGLAERVREALRGAGFAMERRAFAPHLTLARLRDPRRPRQAGGALQSILAQYAGAPLGETRADTACLYRSELSPQGARYTVLHELHLGS